MNRNIFGLAVAGATSLIALSVVWGSWYTIDQGYRGVITRNGAIIGEAEPGLGFKMPWVDSVTDISVQEHVQRYGEDKTGLQSYSFDQQPAGIRLSVNYSIKPALVKDVYAKFGNEENVVFRILDPRVFKALKDAFGQFTAAQSIQKRQELGALVLKNLQDAVEGEPITVTSVQIENIEFSAEFEASVEQQIQAGIEVQKLRQNEEREKVQAQIVVIQAQAQADATVAKATAQANATTLSGNAEATAIRAKAEALKDNPGLVLLIQAERWNGQLPTTMLPNSTVPFMDVAKP